MIYKEELICIIDFYINHLALEFIPSFSGKSKKPNIIINKFLKLTLYLVLKKKKKITDFMVNSVKKMNKINFLKIA